LGGPSKAIAIIDLQLAVYQKAYSLFFFTGRVKASQWYCSLSTQATMSHVQQGQAKVSCCLRLAANSQHVFDFSAPKLTAYAVSTKYHQK